MATGVGPHKKDDGLVFGYDNGLTPDNRVVMSDSARGSKGQPVTNYVAYQTSAPQHPYTSYVATNDGAWKKNHPNAINAVNELGSGITGYVNSGVTDWTNTYHAHWQYDGELNRPVVVMDCFDSNWKAKSFSVPTSAWNTHGVSTGSKYVISWLQWVTDITKAVHVGVYCKNSAGSNNFWDGLSGGSATSKNTKPFTWQRVYHVYTVSSNHDISQNYETIYMYGHSLSPNGAGKTIKIASVQIELLREYPSAYIPLTQNNSGNTGTRSSTESLIDLAGNNSIDVSNLSFDSSTNLHVFDGTDDHITGTLALDGQGAPHTVEMVFSSNVNQGSLGGRKDPFTIGNSNTHQYSALDVNTTNMNWYFYGKDTTFTNSPTMVANQYYHIVLSYAGGNSNNTNKKVYFNGVQQSLSAGVNEVSLLPNNPNFSVGRDRGRNTAYWPGKIPVFKVYNRALTAEEAINNYNSYKQRFDL